MREATSQSHTAAYPAALHGQIHPFRSAVLAGASQTATRTGPLIEKHNALARRRLGRHDDYLRFTAGFRAPADNDGTERDLQMAKLKQEVSGSLHTMTGARQCCGVRSCLSTTAEHGISYFDALVRLTEYEP